ncbi:MAG: sodium-dependent transporter [Gammaproteobacteria bacterium]|nr:sodium-dependent transporter [Gammaproteobacteria bacterium]
MRHVHWSSRLSFVLAAIGASVGLGNVWRFPYLAGTSGGGAFMLVYVGAVVLITLPLLIGELLLGRRGQHNAPAAVAAVAREAGAGRPWAVIGWIGALAGYLILSFYSVIGGWTLAYIPRTAGGTFDGGDPLVAQRVFATLLADPWALAGWHALFAAATTLIVARGLHGGIETAAKLLMPALLLCLLALLGYAGAEGDMAASVSFLLRPDVSRITPGVCLAAVGQGFFSVGISMGIMLTYGSYLGREVSLPRVACVIVGADTLVALLAGFVVFPFVFANGLDPAQGPGLVFVSLPAAFGQMSHGAVFGSVFFILLFCAAVTSGIALLEPMVAWVEQHYGIARPLAAWGLGVLVWLLGLGSALSFNVWSHVRPLAGKSIFDLVDYLAGNLMLVVGALIMSIFVGWRLARAVLVEETGLPAGLFALWRFALRVPVPLTLAVMLVQAVRG